MKDLNFWQERWETKQIGFHLSDIHPELKKYISLIDTNSNILVPLCGKTLDIHFLKQHKHNVIGCEYSDIAIQEFINESKLQFEEGIVATMKHYTSKQITLIQGDFFQVTNLNTGDIDWVYDRAALVALEKDQRKEYLKHLHALLKSNGKIISINIEYEGNNGTPPFSTPLTEIEEFSKGLFKLEVLSERIDKLDIQKYIKTGNEQCAYRTLLLTKI